MHGSITTFTGDPDQLLRSYDAMVADVQGELLAHICLRTDDGIVVIDTCPSRAAYEGFAAHAFPVLCARHGLPEPTSVVDHPVHAVFAPGAVFPVAAAAH